MSSIYRIIVFCIVGAISQNVLAQSNFKVVTIEELNVERFSDEKKIITADFDKLFPEFGKGATKVLIFIDTMNTELRGENYNRELSLFKNQVIGGLKGCDVNYLFVLFQRPKTSSYYYEFPKGEFAIRDNPIYILHDSKREPLSLEAFSKFAYPEQQVENLKIIRYLPPSPEEKSCGKFNFIQPLHFEIVRICEAISKSKISDLSISDNLKSDEITNLFKNNFKEIRELIKSISEANAGPQPKLFRTEAYGLMGNNFSGFSLNSYFHKEYMNPHFIYLSLSAIDYQYKVFLNQNVSQAGSNSYYNYFIQEVGNIKAKKIGLGYKYLKSFKSSPLEVHGRIGVNLNQISSSQYSWTSGSMNVRGKLDGIGDEIINVPDLGYRDGINLVGVNGTADLKRFFPSVEGEVTLHYNLEKMDFFGGVGYTASPILKASRSDLLISDGTHFNSLTATTNPISIRTPFISIGMSIIF